MAVHIPESFHNKLLRSQLHAGDSLINLVGASIGRACLVPENIGPANINQAVAVITPKPDVLLPKFLPFFLISSFAQEKIHGGKVETARPNISLTDLRNLKLPIPPLSEQLRIVCEIIEQNRMMESLKLLQTETSTKIHAMLSAALDRAFNGEL